MFACRGTKWRHIEFEYPASEKRYFDNLVTRTSFALRAYLATARWGFFRVPLAEDRKLKTLPEDNGFRLWLAVLCQQF